MAHFAELDENNNVLRVIVVSNNECLDQNGNENEVIGALFCHKLLGGTWVQTSYNSNIRGKYAAIGDLYDEESDTFISPVYPIGLTDTNFGVTGATGNTGATGATGPIGLIVEEGTNANA